MFSCVCMYTCAHTDIGPQHMLEVIGQLCGVGSLPSPLPESRNGAGLLNFYEIHCSKETERLFVKLYNKATACLALSCPGGQVPLWWTGMRWKNGREVEWFMHCGEKWNWRHDRGEEQADMGGLCCHLRPWWYPRPLPEEGYSSGGPDSTTQGPCLGFWADPR